MFTDDGCAVQGDLVLVKNITFIHCFKQTHWIHWCW